MKLNGENEIVTETKRRGKKPILVKAISTTARCWADYLHNLILEAKKENKKIRVEGKP